jgi:Ni/Co efflux regulator RcnB
MCMNRSTSIAALIAFGLLAASGSALADKPDWAGGGKHGNKHDKRNDDRRDDRYDDRYDDRRGGTSIDFRFSDSDRRVLSDYYGGQARAGHCPPGLAKKHNGCMPPGQAKKWRKGYPLPGDVRYYELSRDILVRLPPPPRGHRYVQVAGDVLLIAIGTSLVVDAVEDLLR